MSQPPIATPRPNAFAAVFSRAGLDWFLLALLGVVALAYLQPGLGSKASPVPWHLVTAGGVALIFFFYGLKLNLEKLPAFSGQHCYGLAAAAAHALPRPPNYAGQQYGSVPGVAVRLGRDGRRREAGRVLWQSPAFASLTAAPSLAAKSMW